MKTWMTTALKLGFVSVIAAFAPAASCDGGTRNIDNGTCPVGESCSTDTPDGLLFVAPIVGEGFFDEGEVKVIAVGGTETLRIEIDDPTRGQQPFELPFAVGVEGTSATLASISGNIVVLRGSDATAGTLRVTDPTDGTLYDRIGVTARAVSSASLSKSLTESLANVQGSAPMLFAPGGAGVVGLHALDTSTLLVDDSMTLTGPSITQSGWDHFVVGNFAPGSHAVVATSAGVPRTLAFDVAAGPDRLSPSVGNSQLTVGSGGLVCFSAFLGERFIHVPWSFTADNADVAAAPFEGCIMATAHAVGAVTIHATGGGMALDYPATAIAAPRRGAADARTQHGSPGVRADAQR